LGAELGIVLTLQRTEDTTAKQNMHNGAKMGNWQQWVKMDQIFLKVAQRNVYGIVRV